MIPFQGKIRIKRNEVSKLVKLPEYEQEAYIYHQKIERWKAFFTIIFIAWEKAKKQNQEVQTWWKRWGRQVFDLICNIIQIIAKLGG